MRWNCVLFVCCCFNSKNFKICLPSPPPAEIITNKTFNFHFGGASNIIQRNNLYVNQITHTRTFHSAKAFFLMFFSFRKISRIYSSILFLVLGFFFWFCNWKNFVFFPQIRNVMFMWNIELVLQILQMQLQLIQNL